MHELFVFCLLLLHQRISHIPCSIVIGSGKGHLHLQQYSHRDIWQRRSYIWCKCHRSRQVSSLAVFSQKLKKAMLYLACNLRSVFLSPTIYCCIRTKCNGKEDSCLPSIEKSTEYLPNFSSFNP